MGCLLKVVGGSRHCFSLVMYGFSSNNALYTALLSFTMFIFLLTLFDCYYFESNLSLVSYKSASYKKTCNVVLKSSKHEQITFLIIFPFIPYLIGAISLKNVGKRRAGGHKRGDMSIKGVVQTFCTLWLCIFLPF